MRFIVCKQPPENPFNYIKFPGCISEVHYPEAAQKEEGEAVPEDEQINQIISLLSNSQLDQLKLS